MTDEMTIEKNGLSYLQELEYDKSEDGMVAPVEFSNLLLSKPLGSGTQVRPGVFNSDEFPVQDIKDFLFIPLNLLGMRNVAYFGEYDANNPKPPDCFSNDGVAPAQPLEYNGSVYNKCAGCPIHGRGKNFKCHEVPKMVGLAYFPELGGLLIPIRKDIPSKSIQSFQAFMRRLNAPLMLNGAAIKLPIWARIARVSATTDPSPYGMQSVFQFDVFNETSPEPIKFVPEAILEDIRQMFDIAKVYTAKQALPPARMEAQLTGGQAPAIDVPSTNPTVVQAEEESDY